MKFDILNRFSGSVQFTAEIKVTDGTPRRVKLGLAIKAALRSGADLSRADLSGADLSGADLSRADLSRADLSGANLYGADLYGASLYGADLSRADLSGALLYGADLSRADLSGALLYGADHAELPLAQTRILPEGAIIGWKKCAKGVIVKLRIPEEARRVHAFGRKCRAEFADVLEIIGADKAISSHDGVTEYTVGKRMIPDHFEADWTKECSGGIHFFITRIEAENY